MSVINESTSVIQIYTPGIVYLSSTTIPGQIVTVVDATGSISSPQSITISSVNSVSSPTLFIQQRFGYITLVSHNSNVWLPINCNSFPTPSSISYKALDSFTVNTSTLNAVSFISSLNATDISTEVYSTANLNEQAFISSLNINSFQRYLSVSVTDPRVVNTGNARFYSSITTVGTFNTRGIISSMGNVFVRGNISSKEGTIYVGGNVTTMSSIRGQRGLLTSVSSISTTASASFNLDAGIGGSISVGQSLSTKQMSADSASGFFLNTTSSLVFSTNRHAIQYTAGYLNFLNIPITVPSISSFFLTALNAMTTSNISLQSFTASPTVSEITLSTAQIQNSGGSISLSTVSGNSMTVYGTKYAPQITANNNCFTTTMSLNNAVATGNTVIEGIVVPTSWIISSVGTNGTLQGEKRSLSTNLVSGKLIRADTMAIESNSITNFTASSMRIVSSLYFSSATLFSLTNAFINNTGGSIIGSQTKIGADIEISSLRTDILSSPNTIHFLGQSNVFISSGILSSITALDIVTSSLSFTNGTFGTSMAYSTINPSTPWLLPSTFGMSNNPFTTQSGLGTYFDKVKINTASDQTAYYSMIDPTATQFPSFLSSPYINTVAGTGVKGYSINGGAASNSPIGEIIGQAASDFQQNLYFGTNNIGWELRKIQSTGMITTVGGKYRYFYGDGSFPTLAALGPTLAVSVISPGTILITDCSNVRLRYINEDPTIMTIAGTGQVGNSGNGGPALSATFRNPAMTVADNTSSIFIADSSNNVIRKYQFSTSTLYAGTGEIGSTGDGGSALSAKFAGPYGLAVDSANKLYITDTSNCVVRTIDPNTGILTKYAGSYTNGFSGDGGLATAGSLSYPRGLAFDPQNNLYICDTGNKRIRRVDAVSGIISTIAGNGVEAFSGNNTPAYLASLSSPKGITTDLCGNLYIADTNNNCIRLVNVYTGLITTVAGQPPRGGYLGNNTFATASLLSTPTHVAFDKASQFIYIADEGNARIRLLNSATGIIYDYAGTGSPFTVGDKVPVSDSIFGSIAAVTSDLQNNIYVADGEGNYIRKIDSLTQTISTVVGTGGGGFTGDGAGLLVSVSSPKAMIVTKTNDILFCDTNNHRVRKYISSSATVITLTGTGVAGYSGDGRGASTATLNFPKSIAIDTNENIYVGDSSNFRIRRIDNATGIITTYAGIGSFGSITSGGSAVSTQIGFVTGLTTDSTNTLYFTEIPTNALWKINPADLTFESLNTVSTPSYLGDGGPLTLAQFNTPMGVIIDTSGNFVVSDAGNYRLRRSYTFGIPQLPVYLNMFFSFTNYYAMSGSANISINGNLIASFNTSSINSTFAITDTNIYSYPLQNSNPALGDQTPYISISQTGNMGYLKLDGTIWVNAVPAQETLQNILNNDAGIFMNSGRLLFPYTINGKTIENEFNDLSTRTITYTGSLIQPSDPALKESIQAANLGLCYHTLATIPLHVYKYIPAFESTFHVQDKRRLGFLTTAIASVFPNSINKTPFAHAWAFTSTIDTLDISQIKYAHLGATQHLIQEVSTLEGTVVEITRVKEKLRRLATQRNVIH